MRNRLKYWRHKLQIDTQKEFAEFLGVKQQMLSRWENQTQQPTLETAWRIKEKLGCHVDDLFEWIEGSE